MPYGDPPNWARFNMQTYPNGYWVQPPVVNTPDITITTTTDSSGLVTAPATVPAPRVMDGEFERRVREIEQRISENVAQRMRRYIGMPADSATQEAVRQELARAVEELEHRLLPSTVSIPFIQLDGNERRNLEEEVARGSIMTEILRANAVPDSLLAGSQTEVKEEEPPEEYGIRPPGRVINIED